MTIVFVYTSITSYMADCWRALQAHSSIRLKIFIEEKRVATTAFEPHQVLTGLDSSLFYDDDASRFQKVCDAIERISPDAIFIVGWRSKLSRRVAFCGALKRIPKVLIFDLPWELSLKKLIAPLVLYFYLKRFHVAFVPGERAAKYARWLGFQDSEFRNKDSRWIERRFFSVRPPIRQMFAERLSRKEKRFLFIGRYAPEKRIDLLVAGYQYYRSRLETADRPWTLSCYGMGDEAACLRDVPGITDCGFMQPQELEAIHAAHDVFVIASDFDPWPLVIAESVAAGLPIICSEACGNHVELIKENGIVCKTGDAKALGTAMLTMHRKSDAERNQMGCEGLQYITPYTCTAWAEHVKMIVADLQRKS